MSFRAPARRRKKGEGASVLHRGEQIMSDAEGERRRPSRPH